MEIIKVASNNAKARGGCRHVIQKVGTFVVKSGKLVSEIARNVFNKRIEKIYSANFFK